MDHQDGAAVLPVVLDGCNQVLIRCLKEGDSKLQERLVPHLGRVIETCVSYSEFVGCKWMSEVWT
jgi:hypothetical protein